MKAKILLIIGFLFAAINTIRELFYINWEAPKWGGMFCSFVVMCIFCYFLALTLADQKLESEYKKSENKMKAMDAEIKVWEREDK